MADLRWVPGRLTSLALAMPAVLLVACGAGNGNGSGSFGSSDDDGARVSGEFSVELLGFPGGPGSGQAHLAPIPDAGPLLSWLEPDGTGYRLRFARFGEAGFGEPRTVTEGERFFVNWADFPSVVPVSATHWVAHWLELQPDSYGAYDAMTAVSADGGQSWSAGAKLNDDDTEAEHGFVSLFAFDDEVNAFWLDGRDLANWSFDEPDALLAVSLRAAKILPDGSVADRAIVDPMVCDCCQPDVAVAAGGPIVTYRDRTEDEIRDIVVRVYRDGQWQAPVYVGNEGWFIEGCPVNGPAIAASGDAVGVAWFTAANDERRVRFARSEDGGLTFAPAIDLDGDGAFGQTDVVVDADGSSVVSWWRRSEPGGIELAVRSVAADGTLGPMEIVANESVSQPVDVPQMLAVDGRLLVAWTTFDGDGTIRSALVSRP